MATPTKLKDEVAKATQATEKARAELRRPAADARQVVPDHPPAVRKGEDSMSSRPFRLMNLLGANSKAIAPENAKVEFDLMGKFTKALDDTGNVIAGGNAGSFYYPLSRSLLDDRVVSHKATRDLLDAAGAGVANSDPDEVAWVAKKLDKALVEKGYAPQFTKTAMSYLTDTSGGALVAPPEMGELIPLMRNKSAVDRAGARTVPLPANGKWVAPRVTGPTTGYWIGENTPITESNPTTGEVSMMAKKLAFTVRVPNELFKYASAAADALLREDGMKTLALGLDYACLYGAGSGKSPKGLIYFTDSNELLDYAAGSPAGIGTNGNQLLPDDGFKMAAAIEDRNFDTDGEGFKWIMRPKMWGTIGGFRADAVTAGDKAGLFVQDLTRALGDRLGQSWCGHPVVRSAQVRNSTSKGGSGTVLTEVFGGVWSEMLVGMYGAVEFVSNPMGDTAFQQDQTLIRGVLHADSCLRYPGAFTWYQQLLLA